MSRMWIISLAALLAVGAMAQEKAVQSGTPALLEAINGNQAGAFLMRLEDGKLTFQPRKSTKIITVPVTKVKSLTFFPKYDAEAVEQQFNAGEYSTVISTLASVMEPYKDYMAVENNMRDAYCLLIDAYRKTGDFPRVREMSRVLMETGDPELAQRGQVNIALIAIEENDLETARMIRGEVTSEAAGLYLQASIERAENRLKDAIWTVSGIIKNHANDVEWLGPSELLCANLYLDMMNASTNSMITTNSPLLTARQVKNIYSGSSVAADAEKLWILLGGAEIEAAVAAEKAEQERIEAERIAERQAEQERIEAEKKAEEEAAAALLREQEAGTNGTENVEMEAGTNVTTNTEMESEKENGGG